MVLQDSLYILTDLCNILSASGDSWYDHEILGEGVGGVSPPNGG